MGDFYWLWSDTRKYFFQAGDSTALGEGHRYGSPQSALSDTTSSTRRVRLIEMLHYNNDNVCNTKGGWTDAIKHQMHITNGVAIIQTPYQRSSLATCSHFTVILTSDFSSCDCPQENQKTQFLRGLYEAKCKDSHWVISPPSPPEILELLNGVPVFSALDLNSGHWQVEIEPDSRARIAFIHPIGLYHLRVMHFDLKKKQKTLLPPFKG